jgi:hypothetical protein
VATRSSSFCLEEIVAIVLLIVLIEIERIAFNVAPLGKVLLASYVEPGLSEGVCIDCVIIYKMGNKTAQFVSFMLLAISAYKGKYLLRKNIAGSGNHG